MKKSTKNNPAQRSGGKLVQHITIRPVLRQRILLASLVIILTIGLVMMFNVTSNHNTLGAVATGDYQTRASGAWNSTTVWQRWNGSSWQNVTTNPSSADGVITIKSGYTITVSAADVTVDQMVIASGGAVVVNSGRNLSTANVTGTDLQVDGSLTINGTLTQSSSSAVLVNGTITLASGSNYVINSSATCTINSGGRVINSGSTMTTSVSKWIVNSGGVFQHNTNNGTLPLATWNSGSTCEVTGATNNAPNNLGQTFSNFTWNCPSQSGNLNFGGALTTINGDLTIASTGSSQIRFNDPGLTYNIAGDLIHTGGTFTLGQGSSDATLNISGDFTESGGTFSVVNGSNQTGIVNVSGNWTRSGGTITVGGNSSTNAQFYFSKSGSQTFTTSGATISGNVDFTVKSGSTLLMGNNVLTGRNFTLSSGGTLSMGSTAGITSTGATGNIQSTGTRTFSPSADYIYNGTSAQNTGSGLPSTVHNLTLTNSNDVTLTNTTIVSNVLTLTSGNLITGSNEIKVTNTATTSITGYSSSSYIVGNLRRSVSGTGVYDYPVGTSANYELATLTLAGVTGVTDVLGKFTNSNPIGGLPLLGVLLSNLLIDKVLSYGYWTMTPTGSVGAGTFSLMLTETGNSAATGPQYSYCAITRTNSSSAWQSVGSHLQGSSTGSALGAGRSGLNTFGDFAIGYGQYLGFKNMTLIAGVDGQVGARYKAPDVAWNVDCWIEIMQLSGGATLSNVDNFISNNGYDEAWQPYIDQPNGGSSSILWKLTFKTAGTSTDTTLAFMAITAIDIDGGSNLNEFVEATMPKSYALGSPTTLTVTNNSGNYRASSVGGTTISNIDTGAHQAMYQINYQNLNSFLYRTGAVNTSGAAAVRQHSLYFKAYFTSQLGLPIKLNYFRAELNKSNKVDLAWSTASEVNNDHFTIERSADGENFEELLRKPGAGNSSTTKYYSSSDEEPLPGYSYYRLKQTDIDGRCVYSETQTVHNKLKDDGEDPVKITSVGPNPFNENFHLTYTTTHRSTVTIQLVDLQGMTVFTEAIEAGEGINHYEYVDRAGLKSGIYFLNMICDDKKQVIKIVKN